MKLNAIILFMLAMGFGALMPSCSNPNQADSNRQESTMQQPAGSGDAAMNDDDDEENEKGGKESMQASTAQVSSSAGTKTTMINNLAEAFKGETTASAKYAAYSKKAQEEGYTQIALLFKATSNSENIHANNHRAVLEDLGASVPSVKPEFTVKTTAENLKDAIAGESYEIATMYPEFITNAQAEKGKLALISLNYAFKTEQRHKPLYEKALAALESNQVNTLKSVYYVCPTCGNTYEGAVPKRCNISMTSSERFTKVENV